MKSSLWRRVDPRRRLAPRLLVALFLAFALPGAVMILVLDRRLAGVEESSSARVEAVRRGEETMRIQQDADGRAQTMDRGARLAEESAWSLASAAPLALSAAAETAEAPTADEHGHIWNRDAKSDSLAYISLPSSRDPAARRDFARSRALEPLMVEARRRLPALKSVSLWTAAGAVRMSPWIDLHEGIRDSGGALESFRFNRIARFPAARPAEGDRAVWTTAFAGPSATGEGRLVSLFVPIRGRDGALAGAIAYDLDPRRYVAQAVDRGGLPGDLWFAIDRRGHALFMPARAGEILRWRGEDTELLEDSDEPERRRLAAAVLEAERSVDSYRFRGRVHRLASARAPTTGWVFVEGLSADRLSAVAAEPDGTVAGRVSELRREAAILFGLLLAAVLGAVLWAARRISAPVRDLVEAAEAMGMGRGHEVEVTGIESEDELGRLAHSIGRMGRRVERRVETLHRLHALLRAAQPTADLDAVLARASEAIGAFTGAERAWFFFHDPNTNRLDAAWPGWNLPQELASRWTISVDRPSIASMVFKTGEIHVSNDVPRDPYSNLTLAWLEGASNAIFVPLKTEGKAIGVVAATNRPGGFGPEEADALVIFADAASLLIQNARLYARLSGTVAELERASRLKDQFLQNVNHELRTPLTSIVGWTDLFGDEPIEPETLQRGLRQIRQSSRLLLALIDDLLDLARLDRGTLTLASRDVSVVETVSRAIETVRLMAEARGVTLLQAPPPGDLPAVRADPLRLQQVLWNLLVNAIKFTPRFGRIIVRIERESERCLVSVEDDGAGIPESELPHVFERFRQVDGSATRSHPGMGIGLSLARSLVELHGGAIWAESRVGQGSRFTFSLPIRAWRRSTETAVAVAEEEVGGA